MKGTIGMEVIARKRKGVGAMYLCCTIVGVFMAIFGIGATKLYFILLGILLTAVGGYIYAGYVALPTEVIILESGSVLRLPKGITLNIDDLWDVSYKCATAKGIQYKWGTVILRANSGIVYKYGYVAECEAVAKRLTEMMYAARYNHNREEK